MKKITIIVLIIVSPVFSNLDDFTAYYSPGIQLGYSFSHDFFISAQISVGVGYKGNWVFPGATVGIRQYPGLTAIYLDAQLSILFMGLGRGITYVRARRSYTDNIPTGFYSHVKFWGFLITYDQINISRIDPIKNYGIIIISPYFFHGRSYIIPPKDDDQGWVIPKWD